MWCGAGNVPVCLEVLPALPKAAFAFGTWPGMRSDSLHPTRHRHPLLTPCLRSSQAGSSVSMRGNQHGRNAANQYIIVPGLLCYRCPLLTDYRRAAFDPSKSFARALGMGRRDEQGQEAAGSVPVQAPSGSGERQEGSEVELHQHLGKNQQRLERQL